MHVDKFSVKTGLLCSFFICGLLLAAAAYAETDTASEEHIKSHIHIDTIVKQSLQATPDLERGKIMYQNCAVCHSPEGWGTPSGHFPQIAGQHKSVIIKQITDIHKGNRDNPTMRPFAEPLFVQGPQALADLAGYISQLPMVPNNSIGYGAQLNEAKKLYDKNCKKCHEANGEGSAVDFYPRIQGQHFSYLERQLHWIKTGKRRNADEKMVKQVHDFNFHQLALLADYVSRMRPDKSIAAESVYWKNPDFRDSFYTAPRR